MPLNFNSITNDSQNSTVLSWILQKGMDECDSAFVSQDKRYFHIQTTIKDILSQKEVGKMVYTIHKNDDQEALEILNLDFILFSDEYTTIRFLRKRNESSDSNEYYEVEALPDKQHLEIETVNRYTVATEIESNERDVRISIFPFELNVYEDVNFFNS